MEFNIFRTYLPKDIDIRPDVANFSWLYIESKSAREDISTAAAIFLNTVIENTKCQKHKFDRYSETDAAKNKINGWRRSTVSKRGRRLLPQAVFYWFFRWESNPSYFMEIAKIVWRNDPKLLKRFCYAKEGGRSDDPFETILNRFHSDEALSYDVVLIAERKRLPVTYAAAIKLGPSYQTNRGEFQSVKKLLLSKHSKSAALTVAVFGPGGYGKSSLAQEICNDDSIKRIFLGGIYWLQFALPDSNEEAIQILRLTDVINRMLDAQYKKSEQPPLDWAQKDSDILKLVEILPAERVLLVADDLGTPQQSSWLSQVPASVSVLMTTRRRNIAKRAAHEITIKRLAHEASYKLLTHGMSNTSLHQQKRFQELAKRFGGWPLLLGLANGVFKQRDGDPKVRIDWSLDRFEQFLADDEIDAWDLPEADEAAIEKRRKFVGFCIEAGLKAIASSNNPDLLRKLAVFPNDTDIPFSVTIDYWAKLENKMISKTRGFALLRHFNDFSFFSSFNEDTQFLRLHDEILGYFRARTSKDQARSLHDELLSSIKSHCSSGWETLPHDHAYGWTQLLHHLEKADRFDEADDLRTDFHWLKAKLISVGTSELRRSFVRTFGRGDARLVGRMVNLSFNVLSSRPESLAHQLFGRLGHEADRRLIALTQVAQSDQNFWPIPIKPHLPQIELELRRFSGFCLPVSCAAFDPTGNKVVAGSYDNTARLWDAETGVQIGEPLKGHRGAINSIAFDPTGSTVLTASSDGTARLWDAETGAQIGKTLEGHRRPVTTAAFDPSGRTVVTASSDGTAWLWDAATGEQINQFLVGHSDRIMSIAFDSSGSRILTASWDTTARIWDSATGAQIGKPLEAHEENLMSAAFDPSGNKIVTASYDKTARLWDAETGAQIGKPLEGHRSIVSSAAFDPSGGKIVTASWDNTARIWDAATGAQIGRPITGHNHIVSSAAFDPSGSRIVTASWDNTARIWDATMVNQIGRTLEGHRGAINSTTFDLSGRKVVTASSDGTARLWDTETGAQITQPLEGHRGAINSAAFDPSGKKIVTASEDNTVRLWDAETGAQIGPTLEGHNLPVKSAAFDPNGRRVVTASSDRTARLWDAETGAQIGQTLEGHGTYVSSAVFDPSGRKVVTASSDGTARLWDAETGAPIGRPLKGHSRKVNSAVFDPRGKKILTASEDNTAQLWDAETGAQIGQPLEGHTGAINSAAFDPSGRKIVTGSSDKTARLWDVEMGTQIGQPLEGHSASIDTVIFDLTGGKIVTASFDNTVRLWDAETGACLAIIDFDHTPKCIACHNNYFVVGLSSGLLCIFLTARDK